MHIQSKLLCSCTLLLTTSCMKTFCWDTGTCPPIDAGLDAGTSMRSDSATAIAELSTSPSGGAAVAGSTSVEPTSSTAVLGLPGLPNSSHSGLGPDGSVPDSDAGGSVYPTAAETGNMSPDASVLADAAASVSVSPPAPSAAGDATPPTVVGILPVDGANGVQSDEVIQITFSEPMNLSSVVSALEIDALASSGYTPSWNADGTRLVITPNAPLAYAQGSSRSMEAQRYVIQLAATAADLAGNSLASAFESSFATLRRITESLPATRVGELDTYGASQGNPPKLCPTADGQVKIGRFSGMYSQVVESYVEFDLAQLGEANDVWLLESAELSGQQFAPTGAFYPAEAVSLELLPTIPWDHELSGTSPLTVVGTFARDSAAVPRLDITSTISAQWSGGAGGVLFRLAPTTPQRSEFTYFSCDGFALELSYLAP